MGPNKTESSADEGEQKRFAGVAKKMDEDIDRFMEDLAEKNGCAAKNKKPFDFAKWCEEIDKHPAFARELKPSEDGQYSMEVQALQAMRYDEDDPVECANSHKGEGNRHFEQRNYRWAVDAYTKAIKLHCADVCLNSVLFANRAAANRRLGNIRSAFKDCFFARRFDPTNVKAIRRGAECLLDLAEAAKCIEWIETSSAGDATQSMERDEQLQKLRRQAEALRPKEDRDARAKRAKASAQLKRDKKLFEALRRRGVCLCPSVDESDDLCQQLQISFGPLEKHSMVRLVEEGTDCEQLIWPLLLQYPESAQTDFVAECPEHMLLDEALTEVFSSPALWDVSHHFRFENVRFFMALSRADGEERIREIFPEKHSLGAVLRWSDVFVTSGLPVIQVYTRQYLSLNKLAASDAEKGIFQFEKR